MRVFKPFVSQPQRGRDLPFQGYAGSWPSIPRANAPWAVESRPVGAKRRRMRVAIFYPRSAILDCGAAAHLAAPRLNGGADRHFTTHFGPHRPCLQAAKSTAGIGYEWIHGISRREVINHRATAADTFPLPITQLLGDGSVNLRNMRRIHEMTRRGGRTVTRRKPWIGGRARMNCGNSRLSLCERTHFRGAKGDYCFRAAAHGA